MARDIEEFLKRAAERRRQQQQQKQPGPPPARQLAQSRPAPSQERRPLVTDDVEVIDDPYAGESVAEHVQQHISTDDITEHAKHLGEEVANRDDQVDERIHEKFDHEVGHLNLDSKPSIQDTTTAVTETEVNADASALFDLLLNPKTVAQSIMLSEILKRPDF